MMRAKVGILVMAAVMMASTGVAQMSFTSLGFDTGASGVSADGSTVVGWDNVNSEAFRWTESSGIVGLGDLAGGSFRSHAEAVSGDGSTVVGSSLSGNGTEAFRWTQSGGIVGLGDLPGGTYSSIAAGVSLDGSTVVGRSTSDNGGVSEAFIWTQAGGMVGLGELSGDRSRAEAVSGDGSTVVGYSTSDNGGSSEAFIWTQSSGMVGLGDLGDNWSVALDISADGSTVVGSSRSASGVEAFRWTQSGGMVGLGGGYSRAEAVSGDGSTVVGWGGGDGVFVWDSINGMRSLKTVLGDGGIDLTDWTLTLAYDISDDGKTIVGTGYNPSGEQEAFVAVIPEPGVLSVMAMCGGGFVFIRRRFVI